MKHFIRKTGDIIWGIAVVIGLVLACFLCTVALTDPALVPDLIIRWTVPPQVRDAAADYIQGNAPPCGNGMTCTNFRLQDARKLTPSESGDTERPDEVWCLHIIYDAESPSRPDAGFVYRLPWNIALRVDTINGQVSGVLVVSSVQSCIDATKVESP